MSRDTFNDDIDVTDTVDLDLATWPDETPPTPQPCEQHCGAVATVYAVGPGAGGWGGRYCEPCAVDLRFQVLDRLGTDDVAALAEALDRDEREANASHWDLV